MNRPWRCAMPDAKQPQHGLWPTRRRFVLGGIAMAATALYQTRSFAVSDAPDAKLVLNASFPENAGPGRFLTAFCGQLSAAAKTEATWVQARTADLLHLAELPESYFVLSNQELFPLDSQEQGRAADLAAKLKPVAPLLVNPYFVVVSSNSKIKSLDELLEQARGKPGAVRYGSSAAGSLGDKYAHALAHATGTSMKHIVYPGLPALYQALANGEVDWAFGTSIGLAAAAHRDGKIRYLAIAASDRDAVIDVPTMAESGGPAGLHFGAWLGLYAGSAVSEHNIEKVRKQIVRATQSPALRDKYPSMPAPADITPARLSAYMRREPRTSPEQPQS